MTPSILSSALLMALTAAGCTSDKGPTPDADSGADTSAPSDSETFVEAVSATVHPEVSTLLQVRWTQRTESDAVWIEYSFEEDIWLSSPEVARAVGEHEAVLLGLPSDTEVTFRFSAELDGESVTSESWLGTTGALPERLPLPTLTISEPALLSPQPWVLIAVSPDDGFGEGTWWILLLDRSGRVVWYRETPDRLSTNWPAAAQDGTHIIFDEIPFGGVGTTAEGAVRRLTLDMRLDETYTVPAFWAVQESSGGRILYDGGDSTTDTWALTELQPDGTHAEIWDCNAWMDGRSTEPYACMPNNISWNPETNSALWSMWAINTIVEIDLASGEVIRQLGDLEGSWAFDPPESRFELQHYPNYTPDGTLLVSCHVPEEPGEQRAREYRLDDASETLTEIWSYGEGVSRYASYMGEASRFEEGNTLIGYGPGLAVREVTPAGEVAWEVEWAEGLLAHATLLAELYPLNQGWTDR